MGALDIGRMFTQQQWYGARVAVDHPSFGTHHSSVLTLLGHPQVAHQLHILPVRLWVFLRRCATSPLVGRSHLMNLLYHKVDQLNLKISGWFI